MIAGGGASSIVGVEGLVGDGIAEEPPIIAGEQEVVRAALDGRRKDDSPDAELRQPADATGRPLDELGPGGRAAIPGAQRVVALDDRADPRLDGCEDRPRPKDADPRRR